MDATRKIILVGYDRIDANSDVVTVYARFTGPDPFTGEHKLEPRTISMSDAALGAKWDEDDILNNVSNMFPMVEVEWLQKPTTVEVSVVSSDAEPAPDSTA